MAQLIRITSEALQATVRRLLPSQQGFGEDLEASNVIQPIIDLTPTAEGNQLPFNLASAIDFTDTTAISANSSTQTLANTPGFYRAYVKCVIANGAADSALVKFEVTNGLATKQIWSTGGLFNENHAETVEFLFFVDTGDSVTVTSSGLTATAFGSVQQVADRYGVISNPSGFTFE
jgi:hypothetical protein